MKRQQRKKQRSGLWTRLTHRCQSSRKAQGIVISILGLSWTVIIFVLLSDAIPLAVFLTTLFGILAYYLVGLRRIRCPSCDYQLFRIWCLPFTRRYCTDCGIKLGRAAREHTSAVEEASEMGEEKRLWVRTEYTRRLFYMARLDRSAGAVDCPNCGGTISAISSVLRYETHFCPFCGVRLQY